MNSRQQSVYNQLVNIILSAESSSPYIVAINGKDASGKTIFADSFADHLKTKTNRQIIRISVDDFMNERKVRRTPSSSEGETCYLYTFNFDAFKRYIFEPLQAGGSHVYKTKIFDYATDTIALSEDKEADDNAIIIVDGVFLFKDDLADYWSLRVLPEVDDEIVTERGAKRDAERIGGYDKARQQYINRYVASQAIYYEQAHPNERADTVINNNDYLTPQIVKLIQFTTDYTKCGGFAA